MHSEVANKKLIRKFLKFVDDKLRGRSENSYIAAVLEILFKVEEARTEVARELEVPLNEFSEFVIQMRAYYPAFPCRFDRFSIFTLSGVVHMREIDFMKKYERQYFKSVLRYFLEIGEELSVRRWLDHRDIKEYRKWLKEEFSVNIDRDEYVH